MRAATVRFLIAGCCLVSGLHAVLTRDWSSGTLYTQLAKRIASHWAQCNSRIGFHQFKNWGLGSELHMWSQALCNTLQLNVTLLQLEQSWVWNDKKFCSGFELQPLRCYFNVTNHCSGSDGVQTPIVDYKNDLGNCPDWIKDEESRQHFRAAAVEILFSRLSSRLVEEAESVASEMFGSQGIPSDLLTVHIRCGDKASEMRLVDTHVYVSALQKLITEASISHPHVLVVTESTNARAKFNEEINKQNLSWKIFHYDPPEAVQPAHERMPVRAAFVTEGATGKASLISLLIALEAKYYVLTTGSNWSRLINELRTNRVDPICHNCTVMVDMQQAHRFHNWRV